MVECQFYDRHLYQACLSRQTRVVQIQLENGADANTQGPTYGTVLQVACLHGYTEIATLLLKHGAKVNTRAGDHETALQAACCYGDVRIVRLLLDVGADINATGGKHGNALITACMKGNETLVRLLLERKALLNDRDKWGCCAIHTALHRRRPKIVMALVEQGADLTLVDCYGRSALDWIALDEELVKKIGRGNIEQPKVSESVRQARLYSATTKLIRSILNTPEWYDSSNFFALGRCLMLLNRFEDAQIAAEYVVEDANQDGTLKHTITCDGCESYPVIGHRFVCKSCAETDLCEGCMRGYHHDSLVPGCSGHDFMEVSSLAWCDGKPQNGCPLMTKTLDWLKEMLTLYSDATPQGLSE